MFKPTDRQTELFGVSSHLADSARERLAKTWAEPSRRKVMPILLDAEKDFADLYPRHDSSCLEPAGAKKTQTRCAPFV